jgi:hypothetical protein
VPHAVARWRKRVDPGASDREIIRDIRTLINEGEQLTNLPAWISAAPGHTYWTHPRWTDVVAILRGKDGGHVVSVLTRSPRAPYVVKTEDIDRLSRRLPPNTLGGRAVVGRLRERRNDAQGAG